MKTHAHIARELDSTTEMLRIWIRQPDTDESIRHDGLATEKIEEVHRLRHEINTLREEREILYAILGHELRTSGSASTRIGSRYSSVRPTQL